MPSNATSLNTVNGWQPSLETVTFFLFHVTYLSPPTVTSKSPVRPITRFADKLSPSAIKTESMYAPCLSLFNQRHLTCNHQIPRLKAIHIKPGGEMFSIKGDTVQPRMLYFIHKFSHLPAKQIKYF